MPVSRRCAAALLLTLAAGPLRAQEAAPRPAPPAADEMMLTIILRHDQSLTLPENAERLKRQHWAEKFPPPGVEVVSWTAVMGVGQIITLRLPPDRLREVNRAVAEGAWGAFRTEFYPTYDYRAIAAKDREGLPNAFK